MRAIHQLIGCTLCIVGIGSAMAANLDVQELASAPHAASNSSSRDSSTSIDVPTPNREAAPASSESPGRSSGNDRSGSATPAPAPTPRTHLGWQSLLPGSIQ